MGFLDNLGKKKGQTDEEKDAAEQAKIDASLKSSEELYEPSEDEKESKTPQEALQEGGDVAVLRMQTRIDALGAQIDAVREQRQIYDEKFTRVNESIGELRALMLDSEKEAQEIKVQAEKSVSLIQAVQPEELLSQVKRVESRLEEYKARMEKSDSLQKTMSEEVKQLKSKLIVFGTSEETLLKLQDQVRRELGEIKSSESVIQRHSEKVEAIFAEVEKDFARYKTIDEEVKTVSDALKELIRDFDSLRLRTQGLAAKKDFEKLQNDFVAKTGKIDEKISSLDQVKENFQVQSAQAVEEVKISVAGKLSKMDSTLSLLNEDRDKTRVLVDEAKKTSDGLRKELKSHTKIVEDRFGNFEDRSTEYENKYDGLENELSSVETRLMDSMSREGIAQRKMLTKIQNDLNKATEHDADFKKRVKSNEKTIAALERQIARLEAKLKKR